MGQFNFRIPDELDAKVKRADAVDWPSYLRDCLATKLDEPEGRYQTAILSVRGVALLLGVQESTVQAAARARVMPEPCMASPRNASQSSIGMCWLEDHIVALKDDPHQMLALRLVAFEVNKSFEFDDADIPELAKAHEAGLKRAEKLRATYRKNGLTKGRRTDDE